MAEQVAWLVDLLDRSGEEVLAAWVHGQQHGGSAVGLVGGAQDVADQGRQVLGALRAGLAGGGGLEVTGPEHEPLRRLLADLSARGAREGATPSETASRVLALREALLGALRGGAGGAADRTAEVGRLVDALALWTFETYVRGREEVIRRQAAQLMELSTPVVRLWEGIVAVPLVGTLDSRRAQVVMEALLQAIVDEHASVAILDITGVPTVDTLVAQNLLKTITATRLMGADCIISGIRPQTAQTIVQLGIDLAGVTSRSTLADALATAIERTSGPAGGR